MRMSSDGLLGFKSPRFEILLGRGWAAMGDCRRVRVYIKRLARVGRGPCLMTLLVLCRSHLFRAQKAKLDYCAVPLNHCIYIPILGCLGKRHTYCIPNSPIIDVEKRPQAANAAACRINTWLAALLLWLFLSFPSSSPHHNNTGSPSVFRVSTDPDNRFHR